MSGGLTPYQCTSGPNLEWGGGGRIGAPPPKTNKVWLRGWGGDVHNSGNHGPTGGDEFF